LAQFSKESSFHGSIQGHLGDTESLLELYRASQVQILEEEHILEDIGSWSAKLLRQQLCSGKKLSVDPSEVCTVHYRSLTEYLQDHRACSSFGSAFSGGVCA
jgi:hypothetical protein